MAPGRSSARSRHAGKAKADQRWGAARQAALNVESPGIVRTSAPPKPRTHITMPDKLSYVQIAEQIQHIGFLSDMPELDDDDRSRMQKHLQDLASRQESKFDGVIGMIKKCDAYIAALENEMAEIKQNLDAWKKNKEMMTDSIKFAYQKELISNKPTGLKYQGVFRKVKPRLVDNFSSWEEEEIAEFGLRKITTITRIKDDAIVEVKQENLPDKDRVREELAADTGKAPTASQLIPGYSFTYERRKRLAAG